MVKIEGRLRENLVEILQGKGLTDRRKLSFLRYNLRSMATLRDSLISNNNIVSVIFETFDPSGEVEGSIRPTFVDEPDWNVSSYTGKYIIAGKIVEWTTTAYTVSFEVDPDSADLQDYLRGLIY
jgi:hypothetical protein